MGCKGEDIEQATLLYLDLCIAGTNGQGLARCVPLKRCDQSRRALKVTEACDLSTVNIKEIDTAA